RFRSPRSGAREPRDHTWTTPEPCTRRGRFAPREVGGGPPPVRSTRGAEPRPATTHAPRIHDPGADERRAGPGYGEVGMWEPGTPHEHEVTRSVAEHEGRADGESARSALRAAPSGRNDDVTRTDIQPTT